MAAGGISEAKISILNEQVAQLGSTTIKVSYNSPAVCVAAFTSPLTVTVNSSPIRASSKVIILS
jgi:hypothetical protein